MHDPRCRSAVWRSGVFLVGLAMAAGAPMMSAAHRPEPYAAQAKASAEPGANPGSGAMFSADKLTSMLPATVYFQGRTAPLQLRNAAGMTLSGGQIVWVSLVDSSGYSTSVQEKYQFYLVTEGPLRIGEKQVPAGAYGGGFVANGFLLMDLGGHTIAEGPLETDSQLRRPRPLQAVADTPSAFKLYLGRRWVRLGAGTDHQIP